MEFEPDVVTESEKWVVVRWNRNALIEKFSWMLLDGVPITANHRLQVLAYTQELRDIPQTFQNADDVEFPEPPYYEKGILPTEQVFAIPVYAPDFIVQSPKPKTDPLEALMEAIDEAAKVDKSIALIVLDLVKYLDEVEKRLKKAKV
jgi:hypothetical protein